MQQPRPKSRPGERRRTALRLCTRSPASRQGHLDLGGRAVPCGIGKGGIRAAKREGDGATPRGTWRLVEVLWRPDRGQRPRTGLPVRPIRPADGWCDAPGDRNYNRPVRHPYPASAERLWRDDHLYDLVVVLDHNRRPRVRGHGSAVFIHLARPGYAPTEGCIGLVERDLRLILQAASKGTRIRVG
ncbi:MAG: L,D-transpeptidase family protein [Proteobacteria bacterium]|nr:L,D-transpeptidase family protein [Pseudomonadota bacterium]